MAMPPNPDTNEVLAAALVAREMELSVIPVGMDKRPLIPWAKYQHEAADEAEITRWFKEFPGAQLAIVTGAVSGITVIDFDDLNADWPPARVDAASSREGTRQDAASTGELPTDAVVRTPRGGAHYYLPYIPGSRNSAGELARGVDVRSEGGYVLCPPSRTEKGQYTFSVGDFFSIGSLRNAPQPPAWLTAAVLGESSSCATAGLPSRAPSDTGKSTVGQADRGTGESRGRDTGETLFQEGERNSSLFRLALRLRRAGLTMAEVALSLAQVNAARCQPPLPQAELRAIAESVLKYEPQTVPGAASAREYARTDAGNAELINALFGCTIRFDHTAGKFYLWRSKCWRPDETQYVLQAALKAARIRGQAAHKPGLDEKAREPEVRWAMRSESLPAMQKALDILAASPSIATVAAQWDSHPKLIGVPGGVLDIEARTLVEARPELLIRRKLGVAFRPEAACPRWTAFLGEIFGSDAATGGAGVPPASRQDACSTIQYVQRLMGYAIRGNPVEQVWVLLHGRGANGKSVFLRTLGHVFGEYGATVPFTCFEEKMGSSVPNDLARLAGVRLAVASETGDNAAFNSARIKAITGGEFIAARFLHREFFEFMPSFVLFMAANRLPTVRDSSEGFWRRVIVVPFHRTFQPGERDPHLAETLEAEGSGILNWVLEGSESYMEHGLEAPASVRTSVGDYREENDPLAKFLEDVATGDPNAATPVGVAYRAYERWAAIGGLSQRQTLGKKTFSQKMRGKFEYKHCGNDRLFLGVHVPEPPAIPIPGGLTPGVQARLPLPPAPLED